MRSRIGNLAQFDATEIWPGRVPAAVAQAIFGLICTGGFIAARSLVDLVTPTAGPFALIYLATLIATLFGSWRAGLVTYVTAFLWSWFFVLPHVTPLQLAQPEDGPRTVVNAATVLVILLFAEIFRKAVRKAVRERDVALAAMKSREAALHDLNATLEKQVAERTRELSQTWNVNPDLLGVLNPDGYFEATNPAWQTVLGWPEAKIRTTKFLEFIHPDDLARTHGAWDQVNAGQPVLRFENRYRRADGNGWCWLSWVVVPEGERFYCSARDVTAEKDAQASLASVEEALRQSQKLEAIGQLTGGVAHDFNNLLTVIRGSVDLLRRSDLSADKRARYIDAIGDTADRAAKLTGQLLAFARRQALKPEVFDIGASVLDVAEMVRTLTGSRIVLETRLPAEACFVRADRAQFDTSIVNMAINARDAMNGEGRLTIATGPVSGIPAVRSHPPIAGDFIAITLADTGSGIAHDDLVRIFEPFFTTKPTGEGTGLGLSQVLGFAKQSDGDVQIESTLGEGATLTLYLPRVYPADGEIDPGAEPEAMVGGDGVCVLVVEDNAQVGEFATQALKELGYDSVLAVNGMQALAELETGSERFHIVFSDVVMPGMNGIDLGQEIRRRYPDVPVILTSGYSHVLAQNGSQGFELLHKPYSVEQLSRVLRKAVAWQRKRRAEADAD